jgi:hypothetical protein
MVLPSCSGTGGIYAKLANGVAQYNCARVPLRTIRRRYDLLHVVDKPIIATMRASRVRCSGSMQGLFGISVATTLVARHVFSYSLVSH